MDEIKERLIKAAVEARKNAYAPISNYLVGAAVLTKSGKIFTGCNVEDKSGIGITNSCAERTAIVKAISEGEREFIMVACIGGLANENPSKGAPCGACRQYLFGHNPEMIILSTNGKETNEYKLSDLLPHAFVDTFEK